MKKKYYRKYLVIVTIILFIGASIIQGIGRNINKNNVIIFNDTINTEFVPGELIVKFKGGTYIDISKNPKGWICTGIPSIDALNEKYKVKDIDHF